MTQPIRVSVDLGPRSYPILLGSEILAQLGATVREQGLTHTNAFVITTS